MTYKIGELNIDPYISMNQCVSHILSLPRTKPIYSIAINAEKIITSLEDQSILSISKMANIRFADGIGIVLALKYKYGIKNVRIPGCELWLEVIKKLTSNDSVYLLGGKQNIVAEVKKNIQRDFDVKVANAVSGYGFDEDLVIREIVAMKPTVVCVSLGTPMQELFISKCIELNIPAIFFGLGGSFDVYAGVINRAPKLFTNYGLEWLYRLLRQPTRISRQKKYFSFVYGMLTGKL
jgi:UDP-N-acetyl-D-mannosaminouronate:lipid I N-acetyl-D-mannosaminouronosyltransferase